MARQAESEVGTTMPGLTIVTLYWHMQWIIQGRPGTGYYAAMCNQSRREYHKAVIYINKHRDMIKRMNFINASLEGDKNILKR